MENRLKGSKEDIVDKKMMEVFELKVMLGQDKEAVTVKRESWINYIYF